MTKDERREKFVLENPNFYPKKIIKEKVIKQKIFIEKREKVLKIPTPKEIKSICLKCSRNFFYYSKSSTPTKRKYCSEYCRKSSYSYVPCKEMDACLTCGKLFTRHGSVNGRKKYCGGYLIKGTCSYNHRQERKKITNQKFLNSPKTKIYFSNYYKKYRETGEPLLKYRARSILFSSIRNKSIEKPLLCDLCKVHENLHGHHTDYNKPLDVMWLCKKCHGIQHGKVSIG